MQKVKEEEPSSLNNDDATSSETLSDVEENEKASDKPDDKSNEPMSPDGFMTIDNTDRESKDDADPM